MQRHIKHLSTLAAAIFLAAGCTANSAEEAIAQTGEAEASQEVASEGNQVGSSASDLSCLIMGSTDGRPSPLREVRFSYDGGEGLLCHGSPAARGREIIGGLVPFGEPWRAGANEPTTFHLSAAISIGGVALEAGSYSMYTIPGESEWEFFLSTDYERWGIPISDAVRAAEVGSFTVTPETVDDMVESLTFEYADGAITMSWEHTSLRIPIGDS